MDVKKKEEMIKTITNRLDRMNEAGVTFIFDFFMCIPDKERWMASTSQERIAELDAIAIQQEHEAAQAKEKAVKEAQQIKEEKQRQFYLDYARMFNAIQLLPQPLQAVLYPQLQQAHWHWPDPQGLQRSHRPAHQRRT